MKPVRGVFRHHRAPHRPGAEPARDQCRGSHRRRPVPSVVWVAPALPTGVAVPAGTVPGEPPDVRLVEGGRSAGTDVGWRPAGSEPHGVRGFAWRVAANDLTSHQCTMRSMPRRPGFVPQVPSAPGSVVLIVVCRLPTSRPIDVRSLWPRQRHAPKRSSRVVMFRFNAWGDAGVTRRQHGGVLRRRGSRGI